MSVDYYKRITKISNKFFWLYNEEEGGGEGQLEMIYVASRVACSKPQQQFCQIQ